MNIIFQIFDLHTGTDCNAQDCYIQLHVMSQAFVVCKQLTPKRWYGVGFHIKIIDKRDKISNKYVRTLYLALVT